jgi:hypothetical protein
VVEVGEDRLGGAAGGVAGRGAGADEVAELPAWGVVIFGVGVVAAVVGDGLEDGIEAAQELGELFR